MVTARSYNVTIFSTYIHTWENPNLVLDALLRSEVEMKPISSR